MNTHPCPGGCGRQIPQHKYACRICWEALPVELREPIRGYYGIDPGSHRRAMVAAARWYAEHRQVRHG